jgi:hypothetical protein
MGRLAMAAIGARAARRMSPERPNRARLGEAIESPGRPNQGHLGDAIDSEVALSGLFSFADGVPWGRTTPGCGRSADREPQGGP